MASITVEVVSSRRQQDQFLDFPHTLYRNDANWIPPVRSAQKSLLGYAGHPFYKTAQAQTFLARRGGAVCGRIAAVLNRSHNEYHEQAVGFFGFFECVDDREAAGALLDAVRDWFAARGVHTLCGPVNPGFEYTAGLLVDGFDGPPAFLTTYNPAYYARLLEGWGLAKSHDLLAYVGHVGMFPAIDARLGPLVEQITARLQIRLRRLTPGEMLANIDALTDVYNRSMSEHWGFVPVRRDEARHQIRQMRHLLVPEFTLAAEIAGRLVGFAIGLPDYNPQMKRIGGRLFPLGFLRLLRCKRRIHCLRVLAANVLPEYQRMGISLVLLRGMAPAVLRLGMEKVEFSWILENNRLSRGSLEKGGAKVARRYRIYGWTSQPSPAAAADELAAPARAERETVGQLA